MSPEERFEQIEALLRSTAEWGNQAEARFNQAEARSIQIEARSIRDHERAMARIAKAEARMDKFDKQLQATKKLVEAGMKMVLRLSAEVREVSRIQKNMLRLHGNGRNGQKH